MIKKILPVLLFGLLFILVLIYIKYPDSLYSASIFQLISFIGSLLLFLLFLSKFFFNSYKKSLILSLGLIILLILKGLNQPSILIGTILIFSILIIFYIHKKGFLSFKKGRKFTSFQKNIKKLELTK